MLTAVFVVARAGEPFEALLLRFRCGVEAAGILREVRRRARFRPRHEIHHEALRKALRRQAKQRG